MATIRNYMRAFNGGIVSPSMYARIDDGKYQTGLAECTNFLVEPQGPVCFRPGFVYVNQAKETGYAPKLISFTFSTDQTMVLEFGHHYVRFHTQGQTLMNGSSAYEISSIYDGADVFDLHYVQSADILTLVHPSYPPMELRRYGASDWRFVEVTFGSKLAAPGAPSVSQHINESVSNPTDYVRKYAVTALTEDGSQESAVSPATSINCNPYGDGSYNTISWNAVSGAGRYRVYRDVGGLWAYIGETTSTSIIDENITADSSITPPIYDDPFNQQRGITSVTVNNQGSGYTYAPKGVKTGQYVSKGTLASAGAVAYVGMPLETFKKLPYSKEPTAFAQSEPYWGKRSKSRFGYPDYPSANSLKESAKEFIELVDISGGGSGAGYELDFEVSNDRYKETVSESDGDTVYYYSSTIITLKGVRVTAAGSNYSQPVVRVYLNQNIPFNGYNEALRYEYTLAVDNYGVNVYVRDSTGSGAELAPVVSNGRITSIRVVKPGSGYSSPTVVIDPQGTGGSGSSATAHVGSAGDYPGAVSYFEQRRWFGGTYQRPSNLWATKSGTESDMSYSLPVQDDDRISVRVAAREANRIRHIVPLQQLILLTGAAEWRVSPLNSDAITPSSMSVRPQSYVGANGVQPLVIISQMLYAAERGGHLRELGYNYEAGGFITADVCLRCPHLFDNLTIKDLAYSKAPWPIVWAVSSSGDLLALTYVPEQQVGAFSRITTDGVFESCAVVAEGDEDILYCVIRRTINGVEKRFVERMHERQFTKLEDSIFMDCSGTYSGEPKTEISGLTWLEGREVCILADGSVEPKQVVTGGKITLAQPASKVHIGLPYVGDLKTLPVAVALQDGSYGSGHQKNVRKVFFRVVDSSGLKAGPSTDQLAAYPARSTEFAGSPPSPITDEFGFAVFPQWGAGGQVCIRQDDPLTLRVISMTAQVEMV